ncbi:ABC transporter ATP-binding protein [Cellulomonas biazotea]|uniref:ABC transporter n=1 Tax=Cellulomonas biazotea TaxID=1709 RepID=A0A402DUC5_9CELL|nr:ABC transporter ATP-binding protein [Cellulomonas biazotea]GCE77707.1 ABC transporter [Cellulomonas biazotea]
MSTAIEVVDVSKRFRMYKERNQSLKASLMRGRRAKYDEFWALRDVGFEIPEGSTYGLIGENGSGKSTLLKCLARILVPDTGSVRVNGSIAALLELGSGFHPELTGRENVYLNGSILGLGKKEIESRFDEIVDFAGIEQFIDQPVKNYSSGMYVRLGFSVAINVDPDILLVDEVLAVGDAAFQAKCMEKFADFRAAGKTVVLVSHAMGTMRTMCDHVAWLDHGKLVGAGPATELVDDYIDKTHADRPVEESGHESGRHGSGEITVERVELLDGTDEAVSSFRTGEALTIRVHYRAHETVERPVFGLAVETIEGTYVWAYHTRDGGMDIPSVAGDGFIDCTVPRLPLQPGTFDVTASAVDWTTQHTYDLRRHLSRFDVEAGEPRESGGIVAMGATWSPIKGDA